MSHNKGAAAVDAFARNYGRFQPFATFDYDHQGMISKDLAYFAQVLDAGSIRVRPKSLAKGSDSIHEAIATGVELPIVDRTEELGTGSRGSQE